MPLTFRELITGDVQRVNNCDETTIKQSFTITLNYSKNNACYQHLMWNLAPTGLMWKRDFTA